MTNVELDAALDELGLTVSEFADLCGVWRDSVYRWLRDPTIPTAIPVPKYAETIVSERRRRLLAEARLEQARKMILRLRRPVSVGE